MTYPLPGSYVVVRTGGIVPWIIRAATDGWSNHAFIVGYDGAIIEAQPGGVRVGHLGDYKGCRMAVNSDEDYPRPDSRALVVNAAMKMVGKPYNEIDLLELGLESLGLGWWLLAKVAADDGGVICSQLVAAIGKQVGLAWMCGKRNAADVRPVDLEERPGMTPLVI